LAFNRALAIHCPSWLTHVNFSRQVLIKNLPVTLKSLARKTTANAGMFLPKYLLIKVGEITGTERRQIVQPIC